LGVHHARVFMWPTHSLWRILHSAEVGLEFDAQ